MGFMKGKDQSTKEAARAIAKSAVGPSSAVPDSEALTRHQPKDFSHSTALQIQKVLESYQEQIVGILQDPRITKSLLTTFSVIVARNPDLKKCTPKSLIGSLMQALILRLNIEPAIGHVYLIPRKNKNNENEVEATFNLGYKGMISLAYRNPEVAKVVAEPVRQNDIFEYVEGTNASLIHKRPKFGTPRGALVGAYAFVVFKSGATVYRVMDREEIMKHKNFSQAKNASFSPWNARVDKDSDEGDWEGSMWAKTPLRGLMNLTPLSTDTTLGIAADEKTITPEMFKPSALPGRSLELDAAKLEDFEPVPQLDPAKEVKQGVADAEPDAQTTAEKNPAGSLGAPDQKTQDTAAAAPSAQSHPEIQGGPAVSEDEELRPPIPAPDTPQGQLEEMLLETQRRLKIVRPYLAEKLHKLGLDITVTVPDEKVPLAIKMCESLIQMHEEKK